MAKLTLSNLANLDNPTTAVNTINANSDLIETALENTLSRNGAAPNQMQADLDMNQKNIINTNTVFATTVSASTYIGGNSTVVNSSNLEFISIAALRAYSTTPLTYGNCRVVSWYSGQNEGGGLFYYDSSDTTSADNGGTIIVDGLSRRWKRPLDEQIDVTMFGTKGDGATDDKTAIQAAITAVGGSGGGIIFFPAGTYAIASSLVNTYNNVTLKGSGRGGGRSDALDYLTASSVIKWTGAAGGTMFSLGPATSSQYDLYGGGIDNLYFNGNSVAATGVLIKSVRYAEFDLVVAECTTVGVDINVDTTVSVDPPDTQHNWFKRIVALQNTATGGIGVRIGGGTGANTSLNHFGHLSLFLTNSIGLDIGQSDGNVFDHVQVSGTNAYGIVFRAGTTPAFARDTLIIHCEPGNLGVKAEGFTSGTTPSKKNRILHYSRENGAPVPVIEYGADLEYEIYNGSERRWSRDVGSVILTLHNTTSVAASTISQIKYTALNSVNVEVNYGSINFTMPDSTSATENGQFSFDVLVDGATSSFIVGNGLALDTPTGGQLGIGTINTSGRHLINGAAISGRQAITYSTSMTPDQRIGSAHTISITDGVAFTINNPTNCVDGSVVSIRIRNGSGGAHGAITWGAGYKMAGALPAIATGFSRTIMFEYNGTSWFETFRSAADVAN